MTEVLKLFVINSLQGELRVSSMAYVNKLPETQPLLVEHEGRYEADIHLENGIDVQPLRYCECYLLYCKGCPKERLR